MDTNLNDYKISKKSIWTGRVDDLQDPDSFRMHQVVRLLDLKKITDLRLDRTKINVCFLGFCCDEGVRRNLGRPGARNGPEYIRKEFANLPVNFSEKGSIYDAGDIHCDGRKMEEAQEQLETAVRILLDNGIFPLILGGGHELALGHFNGIITHLENKRKKNQSTGIINFDAHLDLRPYKRGSSGTMFSQIADQCKAGNRQFSYMCLGVQTYANTKSLFKRADSLGAEYILAKDMTEVNYKKISSDINKFIEKHRNIYLSVCSDVFNSAFAPGVSSLQPFGLDPEIAMNFIKQVLQSGKVISLDIAEVSPRFDFDNRSAKLAAVIFYAIINELVDG